QTHRQAALGSTTPPRERWKRAAFFIGHLEANDKLLNGNDIHVDAEDKHLETQHWLELIDAKHRYVSDPDSGSSLNYLIRIGKDGRLYWEKNNQLVDTAAGDWKDAGQGQGIVPESMPTYRLEFRKGVSSNITTSNHSENQENAATHYADQPRGKNPLYRYLRGHFTTRGVVDRLLRKTVKRNTWIYISVYNFEIIFGSHESHGNNSYFIALIWTLQHFHKFLGVLESRGVDMTKIHISKAEAALWG
ncbi:hypothetical protein CPB84DRAFT_1676388, partial [Gymnopilus junonius]